MKVVFYTMVSPHQLPLAQEVAKLVGLENFTYVAEDLLWRGLTFDAGGLTLKTRSEVGDLLETADVVYVGGYRPIELMERRAKKGLVTLYASERWFKPRIGALRMLVPSYRKMAKRFVKLVNENACVKFLAIGPWAKSDFLRMGIKLDKVVDWGYYVEPSHALPAQQTRPHRPLRVLWAGRKLRLKRVEDVERAVSELVRLKRVEFLELTNVPLSTVREKMREYDTFVMASNAYEGWGAVVSEALEEGMNVIGTFEAGASAAILPKQRLYHSGDVKALRELLEKEYRGELPRCEIGEWTAKSAARKLVEVSR